MYTILQEADDDDDAEHDDEGQESEEGSDTDSDPEVCPEEAEEKIAPGSCCDTPKVASSPMPESEPTGSKEGDKQEKGSEEVKAAVASTKVVSTETKDDGELKDKKKDGESSTFVRIFSGHVEACPLRPDIFCI